MSMDKSLRNKHRKYFDRLHYQRDLGSKKARFTVATLDDINQGVADAQGNDKNTPHDMFVDDIVYADIYEPSHERTEQAGAASIEANFTTLGPSDISCRQDAVSWDKFEELPVGWLNRILGVDISK